MLQTLHSQCLWKFLVSIVFIILYFYISLQSKEEEQGTEPWIDPDESTDVCMTELSFVRMGECRL